ncbi:MAG: hypothetical protein BWY66_01631 [bacterium ADurb.Bin374]|nr:MAG: hypothetical protein BWY66_01631 [bacterium ADurb.Bin374]
MSPNLAPILHFVERLCKQDTVACPLCGLSEKCPKTGFYKRYDPGTGRRIRIQRHLCRNPECPAVTFSVLPPPLLPLFGMTWTMLLLAMMLRPHFSVNALACLFECGRATIRRRLNWGARLAEWLLSSGAMREVPSWGLLCALISRAFFPARSHSHPINTPWPIPL